MTDDDPLFDGASADPPAPLPNDRLPPWPILIVDDEPDVHRVTQLALGRVRFRERGVVLLGADSAAAAREILRSHGDIAVILLDVVMETDDAGLRLVRWIREELGNRRVRIILRTGQPGQAPERQVIIDYDINDYKAKTELSADRLFVSLIAALRAYEDLTVIEASRRGLEKIVAATDHLLERASLAAFASGVLTQIGALLELPVEGMLLLQQEGPRGSLEQVSVLTRSGRFDVLDEGMECRLEALPVALEPIRQALLTQSTVLAETAIVLHLGGMDGRELVAWIEPMRPLNADELRLLRVFALKLVASFRNVLLHDQLRAYNRELERRVEERTRALEASNARLRELAARDTLTGLANRRVIFEQAGAALANYRQRGAPCGIAVFDLDHFKLINDQLGHQAGDEILIQFARRLRMELRPGDTVGRIGGEEFMLLLPECDQSAALARLDALRAGIGAAPFTTPAAPLRVTASFGLTDLRPDDRDFKSVFQRADAALYRAKHRGRDRIEIL